MSNSLNREAIERCLSQYQESLEMIQHAYKDCIKFGYGKIVINIKKTNIDKREVHVEYGRDYKYIISQDDIKAFKCGSRRGSAR